MFSINPAVVPWELNPIGHNSENEVIALFFCCFTVCMKRSVHKFEHRGTFFFFLKCCDSFIFKRDGNMIHWWILSYVSLKNRSVISVLCSGHLGGISVWSPFFLQGSWICNSNFESKRARKKETKAKSATLLKCSPLSPKGGERSNRREPFESLNVLLMAINSQYST